MTNTARNSIANFVIAMAITSLWPLFSLSFETYFNPQSVSDGLNILNLTLFIISLVACILWLFLQKFLNHPKAFIAIIFVLFIISITLFYKIYVSSNDMYINKFMEKKYFNFLSAITYFLMTILTLLLASILNKLSMYKLTLLIVGSLFYFTIPLYLEILKINLRGSLATVYGYGMFIIIISGAFITFFSSFYQLIIWEVKQKY